MVAIEVRNLSKNFSSKEGEVKALTDINLKIHQGEIYGIIGMSGAGKSTLVRCFNYLEQPTNGSVFVEGEELSELSQKQLRKKRESIAMIFQHFNLLMQKNVLENVSFPLYIQGVSKKEARKKALALLELVGLLEKKKAYPSQLSGGQKQRVAIARALATNPKILLCDEATSALDPQTTSAILELLREINQKLGITIVMITHQMAVVREICSHVAIMEKGSIVESGLVSSIFNHPKSQVAKELILRDLGEGHIDKENELQLLLNTKEKIRIVFTENSSFEPVIANLILNFKQPVNILRADTKNVGGIAKGEMILGLPKEKEVQEKMKQYLQERGLEIWEVTNDVDE